MNESLAQAVAANIAESRRLCIEAAALRTRYAALLLALFDARARMGEQLVLHREARARTGRSNHSSSA